MSKVWSDTLVSRRVGSRNAHFEERRRAIARAVMARITVPGGANASLRELAEAAGVTLPTLRHYFGDRDGIFRAALDEMRASGAHWLGVARDARVDLPLGPSMRWFLGMFAIGWANGVGILFSQALAAGFDHAQIGPASVDAILEPVLQAVEGRLAHHAAKGELRDGVDLRAASLALTCPPLMALLHQNTLSGVRCRPLDLDAFLDAHVEAFVRGWGR